VFYPKIVDLPNAILEKRMNTTIKNQTLELIKMQNFNPNTAQSEMLGGYEIKNNQRAILSLTQSNYAYTEHQAHGMTYLKSLTVNVKRGKFYTLAELFKPDSNYIQRISDLICVQIQQRHIDLLGPFTSIRPDQDYYLADKSIVIYFELYEITPYYYGFPMFPISIYDLQDIWNENGPLMILGASN
jgi:hypothetical protein